MSLTITYNILFEVKIIHHYFLNKGGVVFDKMTEEERADIMLKYDAREYFDIIPSEECRKVLNAHQCIFRATSQGLIVGLRAESDQHDPPGFKPFISMAEDLKFTFLIQLRDYEFMNYTALPLSGNTSTMYVFRNINGGTAKQFPSLSATAPLYKPGQEYLPGDMLSNNLSNPSRLFIAKQKTTNPTSNATDWLKELKSEDFPISYVNVNDLQPLVRGTLLYKVKTAGVEPVATVKNAEGTVLTPRIVMLPGDFRILQVDMRGFPEGYYSMHVESAVPAYSDDISFFLLQQSISPFGVIHLQVKSDNAQYNMFDAQGFMQSPSYELRFRNRATHWRYIGKDFTDGSVTDNPLPLTRFGFIENVKVYNKDGIEVDDMPNPSITMIKTEAMTKADEKRYLSEIHIN